MEAGLVLTLWAASHCSATSLSLHSDPAGCFSFPQNPCTWFPWKLCIGGGSGGGLGVWPCRTFSKESHSHKPHGSLILAAVGPMVSWVPARQGRRGPQVHLPPHLLIPEALHPFSPLPSAPCWGFRGPTQPSTQHNASVSGGWRRKRKAGNNLFIPLSSPEEPSTLHHPPGPSQPRSSCQPPQGPALSSAGTPSGAVLSQGTGEIWDHSPRH